MDAAFLQERITKTKQMIIDAEEANIAILSGSIQSYTIDTGQSRSTVTKHNISELNRIIDSLYNRCAMLEARLNGSNATISRPYF